MREADHAFNEWFLSSAAEQLRRGVEPSRILMDCWGASRKQALYDAAVNCIIFLGIISAFLISFLPQIN